MCVVVLRRPGCLLCREEAVKVWADRQAFEAAGVRLVCLVHEWIDREIAAFAPEYWGEWLGGCLGGQRQPCQWARGSPAGLPALAPPLACRTPWAASRPAALPTHPALPSALPGGELYLDESKSFYAAAHGGAVKKGSLAALLNPFGEAWKVHGGAGRAGPAAAAVGAALQGLPLARAQPAGLPRLTTLCPAAAHPAPCAEHAAGQGLRPGQGLQPERRRHDAGRCAPRESPCACSGGRRPADGLPAAAAAMAVVCRLPGSLQRALIRCSPPSHHPLQAC